MATLRDYFDTDFSRVLNVVNTLKMSNDTDEIDILTRIHQDFDSNTKYLSFFIPKNPYSLQAIVKLIDNLDQALAIDDGVEVQAGLPGEKLINSKDLNFSGKIFFYCETEIENEQLEKLQAEIKPKGLYIQYRGPQFAIKRSEIEKPRAFISHDSRDKDIVARPIATKLSRLMCPVWFDEFSLKLGDNLRESIERGIKESKKCILILSKNFLSNSGWTKTEFDSIFTKELIEKRNIVLPIWVDVSKEEVYEYSPSLANKVAIKWETEEDRVIRKIHRELK